MSVRSGDRPASGRQPPACPGPNMKL
jgi:hypothetical protein